jgi:hypothetical protein
MPPKRKEKKTTPQSGSLEEKEVYYTHRGVAQI